MEETFRLGRIGGVRIGVNWSVLVIFGLIAFGLAAERFPATHPGYGVAAYVAAGLATAVVFFASLLAHELAHALVARRNGIEVEGITLWLFGGVARLQGEASSPGAELRIAGVGPLVSVALGVIFLLIASGLGAFDGGGLAAVAVAWLGGINIALAVFNVIPAAPLDGGRLLRAALWRLTGNRLRATVYATLSGRVFGWLLIAFGLLWFLTRGVFGGLWLALIGWFLIGAATMEGQQAVVRERLAGVSARDVMTPEPETVPDSMSVDTFLEDYLTRHRHSAYPVVGDAGEIAGLVTLNRIREVAVEERPRTLLRDVASPMSEVVRATPDDPVTDLLPRLSALPERRCLVFSEGRLVGIVSLSDVTRALERMTLIRGGQRI